MRLTASQTDLALRCAYPFRADVDIARKESAAGSAGTIEHAHIEATLAGDDDDPDEASRTHARWLAEWWEEERLTADWQSEVAIALDPRTGEARLVPRTADGHRDYSAVPEGFIAGTADAVAWDPSARRLRITDWKSGQADAYRRRELVRGPDGRMVARSAGWRRPSELGQMLTLGAAFARHFSAREVSLELVPVNETRLHVEVAVVGKSELRLHEQRLVEALDEADGPAQPRPGPWCARLYCALHGHCPATAPSLQHAAPATALGPYMLATHSSDFESPEHAGWQHLALEAAEARIAAGRLALRIYLKERGPARLPDGSTVALEPQSRETIELSAPGAEDVLRRELGPAADAAIETRRSTSKAAIYDAVKPAVDAAKEAARAAGAKVRGISYLAAQERVVDALRAVAGAVKRSEFDVVKVVPPVPPVLAVLDEIAAAQAASAPDEAA